MSDEGKKGEEGKKEGEQFNAEAAIKSLTETVGKIAIKLEEGSKKEEGFDPEKFLRELREEEGEGKKGDDEGREGDKGVDFEKMSAKDFVTFVMTENRKAVQEMLQPVVDRVEQLRVRSEVKECKEKYPDFMEHKDAIFKLAMTRGDLSIEEAYLQVAGKSSVEARNKAEKEKGEKEAKEKKEKEEKEKGRKNAFFGERGGHSRQASQESPDSIEQAATLALRDVLGVDN